MKWLDFYEQKLGCSTEGQVFEYLLGSLKPSSHTWDYFVDWPKMKKQAKALEYPLHLFNSLVGKSVDNFDDAFRALVGKYPEVINVIPVLIACRPEKFRRPQILEFAPDTCNLSYRNFNFKEIKDKLAPGAVEDYLQFVDKIGLKSLMSDGSIKNLHDYVFGVEVGLNSNARKNRGGKIMETIVEGFLSQLAKADTDISYINQVTSDKLTENFGVHLPPDLTKKRIFDFVLQLKDELFFIETNFYNGGGSKLKSTAHEYRDLGQQLKQDNHHLIWVTDGVGWLKSKPPLEQAFNSLDYVFNLAMLEKDVLSFI